MTLHPIGALVIVAFVFGPQYWAIRSGRFNFWWMGLMLVFHVVLYRIGFVADALQAEFLIREIAA